MIAVHCEERDELITLLIRYIQVMPRRCLFQKRNMLELCSCDFLVKLHKIMGDIRTH